MINLNGCKRPKHYNVVQQRELGVVGHLTITLLQIYR